MMTCRRRQPGATPQIGASVANAGSWEAVGDVVGAAVDTEVSGWRCGGSLSKSNWMEGLSIRIDVP